MLGVRHLEGRVKGREQGALGRAPAVVLHPDRLDPLPNTHKEIRYRDARKHENIRKKI